MTDQHVNPVAGGGFRSGQQIPGSGYFSGKF
jgi:hypothetical protein